MSTMRIKNKDGGWDKVPVLGSYQAVIEANAAAVSAQNAATSVRKHKALWFDSVAAMKAEPSLTAGAYVNTAGYYSPNDGGGASYLIREKLETDADDGGSVHELVNGLVAELVVENGIVNVKQFGAKGDGVTDETDILQNCFNCAYDHNWNVLIAVGTFNHTGLVFPTSGNVNNSFFPTFIGENRNTSKLNHIGTGIGVTMSPRSSNATYVDGIDIKNLSFVGNENTTIGLEIPKGAFIHVDSINVTGASQSCIEFTGNVWVSSFTKIYLSPMYGNGSGFIMEAYSYTTIEIDEIFVQSSKNIAYKICGTYSSIGRLAADNCTGEDVYYFNYFNGHIDSLGCENCNVKHLFTFVNSNVTLGYAMAFNPTISDNFINAILLNSSFVNIGNISIFDNDASNKSFDKKFVYLLTSKLTIGKILGNYTFTGGADDKDDITSNYQINDNSTFVSVRAYRNRPYLGNDRRVVSQNQFDNEALGAMIVTSCLGSPRYKIDGTDCRWTSPVTEGDWFMESKPSENNVAGYVITKTTSQLTDEDAGVKAIPLILTGTTASRPSSCKAGTMFFDTSINKPIWYTGSAWVDATGTTV